LILLYSEPNLFIAIPFFHVNSRAQEEQFKTFTLRTSGQFFKIYFGFLHK